MSGFRNLKPILDHIDVQEIIVEGDKAAVLYDFVTDTPAGSVLSAEWLQFEDGLIRSSVLMFDQRQWPLVMEELGKRAT